MITVEHKQNICPHCGAVSIRCYHTERFSETYIVRYYRCGACGRRFKTEQEK